MAEGLFRRAVTGREKEFVIGSAGVAAVDGYPSTLETIRAMSEAGIDISGHKSRRLTRELAESADKIYVMEKLHREMIVNFWPHLRERVHLLTEFLPEAEQKNLTVDIPDPIHLSDDFYRRVLKMVDDCIKKIAETI